MMVIHQRDGADHARFGRLPGLFHELVADEIAKSLRPVRVAALIDQLVELVEELGIDGHANTAQIAHG